MLIPTSQILDILLDQNNSAQMPLEKRVNLDEPSPALPPLHTITLTSDQLAAHANAPSDIQPLYRELVQMHSHHAAVKARINLTPAPKSLAHLLRSVPHKSLSHPQAPSDFHLLLSPLDAQTPAPGYLTPNDIDDTIESLDIKLGLEAPLPHLPYLEPPTQINPSFGNANSPYNWLRKHVPHIFLQDAEDASSSTNPNTNNKSKPGALRGAGKRAPIPHPSKPLAESLEIVEEDGLSYDFALGGPISSSKSGGKRKRIDIDEDPSGGYHPKTGRVEEQLKLGGSGAKKPRVRKSTAKVVAAQMAENGGEGGGMSDAPITPAPVKRRRPRVTKNQLPGTGIVNVTGIDM